MPTSSPAPPSAVTPAANEESASFFAALGRAITGPPGLLEFVEVEALQSAHRGHRVKVHGWVRDGSIARHPASGAYRFAIGPRVARGEASPAGPSLVVEYAGVLPERFQDRLEVVVTGRLADDGATLVGDDLVAKCPTSYE